MELCQWRSAIEIIFPLLMVSLKEKNIFDVSYKQKNTRKTTTENIIETVNNFSHILFCRHYVDFGSKICLYLIKTKFSREKEKNRFESCVLKINFLSLPPKYGLSRTPFGKYSAMSHERLRCWTTKLAALTFPAGNLQL